MLVGRVTLAHPLFLALDPDEQAAASPYFPLGLLYLAGWLREQGHNVTIFDGTFAEGPEAFARHLDTEQPDVVGISALVTTRDMALELATIASDRGFATVLGGPDPTLEPGWYLRNSAVDIVVHHEGEQTITRLLELADAGDLHVDSLLDEPGVAYRRQGVVHVNDPRPPIENLDELPLPARDLIDMDRYLQQWQDDKGYSSITVATTRGCPYGCQWCSDAVHGDGFRQRSPESVANEVKQLKDRYGVESIRLVDDVDGIERDWIESWAQASEQLDAAVPFEGLNRLSRGDLPLLEVRDSL